MVWNESISSRLYEEDEDFFSKRPSRTAPQRQMRNSVDAWVKFHDLDMDMRGGGAISKDR